MEDDGEDEASLREGESMDMMVSHTDSVPGPILNQQFVESNEEELERQPR